MPMIHIIMSKFQFIIAFKVKIVYGTAKDLLKLSASFVGFSGFLLKDLLPGLSLGLLLLKRNG